MVLFKVQCAGEFARVIVTVVIVIVVVVVVVVVIIVIVLVVVVVMAAAVCALVPAFQWLVLLIHILLLACFNFPCSGWCCISLSM